jgi:hypothetical protein
VLGLVSCARRWREPVPRFLLAGLALAPATAAVTYDGTPHALRSTAMLPFLLVIIGIGWAEILAVVQPRRLLLAAVVLAVCIDAGGYMWDLYVRWPGRALAWFDSGELAAVHQAQLAAHGHHIWLSERLDQVYIQALFDATPPPSPGHLPDSSRAELAAIGATAVPDGQVARQQARPGDIVVLAADEGAPDGATLIDEESVTVAPDAATLSTFPPDVRVLARVYRV